MSTPLRSRGFNTRKSSVLRARAVANETNGTTREIKVKRPCADALSREGANRFQDDSNNFTAIGENCAKEKRRTLVKDVKISKRRLESEARS